MNTYLLALIVTVAYVVVACGGSGDNGAVVAQRTPGAAAPRNLIAFGAENDAGDHALYIAQPDGTSALKLVDDLQSVTFPRWSPDGARIAFIAGGGRGPGTKAALRVYDFDGAITTTISENVLASGDEPPMAWSPDGARIAFIDANDGGTLRVYDFDKTELLDEPAVLATAIDWSTNDEFAIVAPAADPASVEVSTLQPGDDEPRLRLTLGGAASQPAWSLAGESLAFWSGPSIELTGRTLFVLPDGAQSADDLGPGTDPVWSGDARLAYSRPATPGTRGELDIYVAGLDGEQPARVTQSITLDRWPSWSPAADAIAYLALADASTAFVCVIALESLDNTCFDLPGLTPSAPAWSPY